MDASLSAAQVAAFANVSKQAVIKRASRESWPCTEITGRGGRQKRYRIDDLPDDIRLQCQTALIKKDAPDVPTRRGAAPDGLNQHQVNTALARADLLKLYQQRMGRAGWGNKSKARKEFMRAYNSGLAWPRLFEQLGKVSWQTIEGWKRTVAAGGDVLELADRRGYHRRGQRLITGEQEQVLLKCLLHPNRPRISEAVRMAKAIMASHGIPNGHSEATYRRWIRHWQERNHHIWTFAREGAKAWNDQCAPYIERDYNLIKVGDVIVADGHVLNFEILNPWTGKPKRMSLILWQDMKSTYPLGWEIMPTEDTQAISSALRHAILRLGMYPQVAYLDNGKAFRARFFESCPDFAQAGLTGLYERLGMKTIHAWPYHGQSKTVERFFGTFAELERWCPTYTGTSIEAKPPRLMRGERLHRRAYERLTGGQGLTLEQAHRAIAAWFDEYVQRPSHGHLAGRTPAEVFEAETGPGIDAGELHFLMMSMQIRHIRRNGIWFQGQHYYHPELHGRRHPVTIRYDLQDPAALLVFEPSGEFICEAAPVEKVHPAATALGSEADQERLRRQIELKRGCEREASTTIRAFLETEVLPAHRRRLQALGIEDGATVTRLPAPEKKQLTAADQERILAEVQELQAAQDHLADNSAEATVEPLPTAADPAAELQRELGDLNEADRYERLIELEIQGAGISDQWRAFMRYFEMTPEYERSRDYFESRRTILATAYQAGG